MKKTLLFLAVILLATISFAAEITSENFQRYIGKHIKFTPDIDAAETYKIGPQTFKTKKYAGVVLTIANVELDKKGNLILFLEQELENGKTDKIKAKAKASKAELQNIIVVEDEEAKRKAAEVARLAIVAQKKNKTIPPATQPKPSYTPDNSNLDYSDASSNSSLFLWVMVAGGVIVAILFVRSKIKDNEMLETVTTRPDDRNMGTRAEKELVLKLLKFGIPAEAIFHDLYLKKPNGQFSQIDVVAVTDAGIIVFEVKDYSGWIFGNGKQNQWTQVLAYGQKKYRFYNPIMQNNWHITALRKQVKQFANVSFYSVIVFFGDCELKDISFVPEGTFIVTERRITEVVYNIISKGSVQYANRNEVINRLKAAVKKGDDEETQDKHVENVREMLGKDRIFK